MTEPTRAGDPFLPTATVTKMKAIVQDEYGRVAENVLRLEEIDIPTPGDDDVLMRVHAASIHIGDWHVMTGMPYMLRVVGFGLRRPKVRQRGMDVAGSVEAVGKDVTQFRAGDDVFGTCKGAFAAFACASEDELALKPENLTFEQAATVPTSALAALQGLRDKGQIRSGQHVLVVGASGGVGLFAVQVAKSFGAEVTGVCGTAKVDLVRSAGADHTIDYTKEDFARGAQRYDLVLDMGGNRSLSDLRRSLTPNGTLVLAGGEGGNRFLGGTSRWIQALVLSPFVRHKLRILSTQPRKQDLLSLKELIESGKLTPVIDRTFPLTEVPAAFRYVSEGRARGKVVITI
jgi:NADPH:quinone reductase-like Zn-dependent oxidoreductase